MEEKIKQLEKQVQQLREQLDDLSYIKNKLDDIQVERVINANTSGSPSNNDLLMTVIDSRGDVSTSFAYPSRIMIYTWKGQRLAIPVYDATNIIYP